MILSASRRTDIPAFYSEWFFNRLQAGFVDVRNPMNIHHVSRIEISPDVLDCIVFWTKNPSPMLERINELSRFNFYFQFSVNPYSVEIEKNVPIKKEIINTFIRLSDIIGAGKVVWRYDPILLSPHINIEYHIKYFEKLARRLSGYTNRCVISFIDLYKKTISNTKDLCIQELKEDEMRLVARRIEEIAFSYGIKVQSCSESIELSDLGIDHGCCIDKELIEEICGYKIDAKKDKNQRKECGCIESVDVGAYNTCLHKCAYCYANYSSEKVAQQSRLHNPKSSMIIGELNQKDVIKIKDVRLLKTKTLF